MVYGIGKLYIMDENVHKPIGNVANFKLNLKKEKPMSKKQLKINIANLENEVGVLQRENREGRSINRGQSLTISQQQREINHLNSLADKNLENFKILNDKYQKAIDFIGSITDDMKVNIIFKSS